MFISGKTDPRMRYVVHFLLYFIFWGQNHVLVWSLKVSLILLYPVIAIVPSKSQTIIFVGFSYKKKNKKCDGDFDQVARFQNLATTT